MTPAQRGRAATAGLYLGIAAGLMTVIVSLYTLADRVDASTKATVKAAAEDAAWRARADEHQAQCEHGLAELSARIERIEDRIHAYESWPRLTK